MNLTPFSVIAALSAVNCALPPFRWVAHGIEWTSDARWLTWRPWNGIAMKADQVQMPMSSIMEDMNRIRLTVEELGVACLDSLADLDIPPILPPLPCPDCKGTGKDERSDEICKDCDGQGSRECDLGHRHPCESCDGHGHRPNPNRGKPCESCDGTGTPGDRFIPSVRYAGHTWDVERMGVLKSIGASVRVVTVRPHGIVLLYTCSDCVGILVARMD